MACEMRVEPTCTAALVRGFVVATVATCSLLVGCRSPSQHVDCRLSAVTIPRGNLVQAVGYINHVTRVQFPHHPSIVIDPSLPALELRADEVHGFEKDELMRWYDSEVTALYTNNPNAAWLCPQGPFTFESIDHKELVSLLEAIFESHVLDAGDCFMWRLFPERVHARVFDVADESMVDDIEVSYRAATQTKSLWFITSKDKDMLCVIASHGHHRKAAKFLEVYSPESSGGSRVRGKHGVTYEK
jgi:hypothetical protein